MEKKEPCQNEILTSCSLGIWFETKPRNKMVDKRIIYILHESRVDRETFEHKAVNLPQRLGVWAVYWASCPANGVIPRSSPSHQRSGIQRNGAVNPGKRHATEK